MRNTKIAMAVLALVASSAALADGVTVYGTIDASVAKTTGAKTAFDGSGNWSGSIFGFKGSEDLDNGMKASFNLEMGYNAANGTMANGGTIPSSVSATSSQGVFNRLANVALSGDFGSVKLGQQLNAYIGAALGGIVNANESLYVPMLLVTSGFNATSNSSGIGLAGVSAGGTQGGFFANNAVSYTTPSINGLTATIQRQIQGASTSTSDESTAAAVNYSFSGVNFAFGYLKRTDLNTNMSLTANTTIGDATVGASYFTVDPNTGTNTGTKITTYALHGSIPVAPNLALSANYVSNNQTNSQTITNAGLQYNLSKSTYLYGTISRATNGAMSLYASGASDVGANNTGYAIGMVKNF